MKTLTLIASAAAIFTLTTTASAQDRWAFELRSGAALPTEDVGTDELGMGFGFDGTLQYRFQPHLAAYAGWDWMRFSPETSFAGDEIDFEETGYAFGLRFQHPFSGEEGPVGWWLRAGGTYDHLELEDADGEIIADSGHGFGFELGAGVAVALGDRFTLTPGARFRSLSRDVETEDGPALDGDLRYGTLGVGLALAF